MGVLVGVPFPKNCPPSAKEENIDNPKPNNPANKTQPQIKIAMEAAIIPINVLRLIKFSYA